MTGERGCDYCGARVDAWGTHCSECGAPIRAASAAVSPPVPTAPQPEAVIVPDPPAAPLPVEWQQPAPVPVEWSRAARHVDAQLRRAAISASRQAQRGNAKAAAALIMACVFLVAGIDMAVELSPGRFPLGPAITLGTLFWVVLFLALWWRWRRPVEWTWPQLDARGRLGLTAEGKRAFKSVVGGLIILACFVKLSDIGFRASEPVGVVVLIVLCIVTYVAFMAWWLRR